MVNENINEVNFSSKTKEELSKMNSVSGKKSLGAKKRWFREKNPDIQALMEFYKSGNQLEVMEKYMFELRNTYGKLFMNTLIIMISDDANNRPSSSKLSKIFHKSKHYNVIYKN